MPYRDDIFRPGHYYHIYNRGAGTNLIFLIETNYRYLLNLIQKYRHKYRVTLIAYCLMPNHYHFLLRQDTERPISDFVRTLFNAYVQAVNKQQNRSGTLFEGRFKHIWINREEYLVHLCRYIHLNPVKAGLVKSPEKWDYSNYLEWINERSGTLVDQTFIDKRFPNRSEYQSFVRGCQDDLKHLENIKTYLFD